MCFAVALTQGSYIFLFAEAYFFFNYYLSKSPLFTKQKLTHDKNKCCKEEKT
jgi:hypothetical protein